MANVNKNTLLAPLMRQLAQNTQRSKPYQRAWTNNANKIEAFSKHSNKEIYTDSFTAILMEEYIHYLQSQSTNYKAGTIRGFGQKLGEALRKAAKGGYDVDFGFEDVELPTDEPCSVYLDEKEIERIFNLKGLTKGTYDTREMFVLACCTGLRFSDISKLSMDNFQNGRIRIKTVKTNTLVELPLHWMVTEILKRNKNKLPKMRSEQFYNNAVKRLAKMAGIDGDVIYEQIEGLEVVKKTMKKYELVSSHTARRSFATNMHLRGIDTGRIMLLTGHTTEQSFFKYIRIGKNENAKFLSEHTFFSGDNANLAAMAIDTPIGQQIAFYRKKKKLTQEQLADLVGMKRLSIANIEQGHVLPSTKVLEKVAAILDCDIQLNLIPKK
jgi:integrase/DNA-binding XRE family transcriptional regulator